MSYWQRYIAYLKEWAETHSGEEFAGMSPACYDEWLDNESGCQCPLGGDETNDCADCAYAGDYHFVDGECVERGDNDE